MPADPHKDKAAATDDLQTQLDALRADIAALAALLQTDGRKMADTLRARAEELRDQTRAEVESALGDIRANAGRIEDQLESRVRDKPLQSLLMAFGLGLVVSVFLRR